jgi:hypothetical protein
MRQKQRWVAKTATEFATEINLRPRKFRVRAEIVAKLRQIEAIC